MIAIIGIPRLRGSGPEADVAGLAASIASAAATAGSRVELVGKTGDDPAGDAVLIALARRHVGHVATLRDPARATPVVPDDEGPADPDVESDTGSDGRLTNDAPVLEAADVGLALRYLPELAVIVTVHATPEVIDEAIAAAGWAATDLIVVVADGEPLPDGLPDGAVAIGVTDADEIEAGAGAALGRYAAALDQGRPADAAYAELIAENETLASSSPA